MAWVLLIVAGIVGLKLASAGCVLEILVAFERPSA